MGSVVPRRGNACVRGTKIVCSVQYDSLMEGQLYEVWIFPSSHYDSIEQLFPGYDISEPVRFLTLDEVGYALKLLCDNFDRQ